MNGGRLSVPVLTRKRATIAAKKAQDRYKGRGGKKAPAWAKGGRPWSRGLGHFGAVRS